jgi:hypothetical protein
LKASLAQIGELVFGFLAFKGQIGLLAALVLFRHRVKSHAMRPQIQTKCCATQALSGS